MRGKVGPTTHITSLAKVHEEFCIQMIRPWLLLAAIDESSDLRHDLGDSMQEHFMELLGRKYENCTDWYLTNLDTWGVQEPIVIIIRSDGKWQMDEGHHRLAWSLFHNIPHIPVFFDDSGADDDSTAGYMVARANVDAYHYTWEGDERRMVTAVTQHNYSTNETEFREAAVRAPKRRAGRHRAAHQAS